MNPRSSDTPRPSSENAASQALRQLAKGSRRYTLPLISLGRWRKRFLLVGAGLLTGLVCILFALGAELAITAHQRLMHLSPWLTVLIAPAGFALVVWVTRRYFLAAAGSGIPQAVAAAALEDGTQRHRFLSLRIAFAKVGLTITALLAGASVGREGPSVQVGASIMHTLAGRRFGRIAPTRDLIIAGGAAGIAAAFNTPLGGIFFAIEEMSRYRAFRANSTTLVAVIFAGLMSLAILGNYTYFGRTPGSLGWPGGIVPVLVVGALGGLAGGFFSRLLLSTARGLPGRAGDFRMTYPVRFAALCGLGVALLGLLTGGQIYGTGYGETRTALEGVTDLPFYYGAAKAFAIWLAFACGLPGGFFAPALAVGAGLGTVLAAALPGEQSGVILVLGMVTFLSGLTQAPITSFVIVMEMTANHQMLIPLMAASVLAHGFSRVVAPTPLYHALTVGMLRQVGRDVAHGESPLSGPDKGKS